MPLGMEESLGPGDFVLDGDPAAPPPKKKTRGGAAPHVQFSAHFYSGQTAGCIKMLLGMEVGLSPGDFVLHDDLCPFPKNGAEPHSLRAIFLWPNGCMDQDATWYGGRPRPRRHCVR